MSPHDAARVTLPRSFWDEPAVLGALRARDVGALFDLVLSATGAGQTRLGIDVGMPQGRVSKIKNGRVQVEELEVFDRIATGLRMPGHARIALGLAPDSQHAGHPDRQDPVLRRDFLARTLATGAAVAAGALDTHVSASARRPDRSTAEHLAGLVHILRHEDDVAPTGSLLGASARLLDLAETWTAEAGQRDRDGIGRVAAEAALLHWWLTVDAGLDSGGARERAMALAVEWDVPALIGHMFGWRAGLALRDHDPHGALRLTQRALEPRWGLSAGAVAWAAGWQARTLTLLGDADGQAAALDLAEAALDDFNPASEPPWMYWLASTVREDRLELALLRTGADAAPAMNAALAAYPAERTRDVAWYRAHIAAARVRSGDVEGAAQDAAEAARLAAATGTSWTMGELSHLAAAPHLSRVREALADA